MTIFDLPTLDPAVALELARATLAAHPVLARIYDEALLVNLIRRRGGYDNLLLLCLVQPEDDLNSEYWTEVTADLLTLESDRVVFDHDRKVRPTNAVGHRYIAPQAGNLVGHLAAVVNVFRLKRGNLVANDVEYRKHHRVSNDDSACFRAALARRRSIGFLFFAKWHRGLVVDRLADCGGAEPVLLTDLDHARRHATRVSEGDFRQATSTDARPATCRGIARDSCAMRRLGERVRL